MNLRLRRAVVALPLLVAAPLLPACGSSSASPPPGAVSVVATTDVYGSIAKQIAGRLAGHRVRITSVIDDPSVDPHSYEANARTALAFSRADVIIENGGGYDDFADRTHDALGSHARVLNAYDIAHTGQDNEHVWYDFPAMRTLADRIARVLGNKDASDAATFRVNARRFDSALGRLEAVEHSIRAADHGAGVAITEPVPLYLLLASGLVNRTPAQFSEAVEEGNDVPPAVLRQMLKLFADHRVRALVYNEQTSGAETRQVLAEAHRDHVPAVPVTETLPAGTDYLSWMRHNVTAVRHALSRGDSS